MMYPESFMNFIRPIVRDLRRLREQDRLKRAKFMKRYSLAVSCALLLLWCAMGTTTTLAWFSDSTPAVRNSFVIGMLDLDVEYRNDRITQYTPVDKNTAVFNDQALYEPGYTQVVYLKIRNNGTIPFQHKIAVDQYSYNDSINVYGGNLHLPNFLRFGVLVDSDEQVLVRRTAQAIAKNELAGLRLNQYAQNSTEDLLPGETCYAALVVYMPQETGNAANYRRGEEVPSVSLGVTIYAQQSNTPMP